MGLIRCICGASRAQTTLQMHQAINRIDVEQFAHLQAPQTAEMETLALPLARE